MNKRRGLLVGLGASAIVVALVAELFLMGPPRRRRPEGFRAPWDGVPLLKEGEWSTDALKRGVVQGEFFSSTDELAQCVKRFDWSEGEVLVLELLVETGRGGTHFEYVDAAPHPVIPKRLSDCVTGVLERAVPLPTPALPEGTRWRLQVNFLVPSAAEVVEDPWWKRFLPNRWRGSGGDVG